VILVALLLLMVGPVMGQETAPAGSNAAFEVVLLVVVGGGTIGALTLAYVAVSGLRDSFPPGTAESWGKLWEKIEEKTATTPTSYDDLAVAIAGPLFDSIMRAIQERERAAEVQRPLGETLAAMKAVVDARDHPGAE
jgi:hypothetical protein